MSHFHPLDAVLNRVKDYRPYGPSFSKDERKNLGFILQESWGVYSSDSVELRGRSLHDIINYCARWRASETHTPESSARKVFGTQIRRSYTRNRETYPADERLMVVRWFEQVGKLGASIYSGSLSKELINFTALAAAWLKLYYEQED